MKLDRSASAGTQITENESSAAAEEHAAAMTTGRIRKQHVDTRVEQIGGVPAHRVDIGCEPPFPHHVAARGHKAKPYINRRLNHDAAADVLRLHVGDAEIHAEL